MDEEFLAEVYVKQGIREEGVLPKDLSEGKIREHEEVLAEGSFYGFNPVSLTGEGIDLAENHVSQKLPEAADIIEDCEYAPFLSLLLIKKDKIPVGKSNLHPTSWYEYYLKTKNVWNSIHNTLVLLESRGLVQKATSYVSTRNGETRSEYFVWPKQILNTIQDQPFPEATTSAVQFMMFSDMVNLTKHDRDAEDQRQRYFEYLDEYGYSEKEVEAVFSDISGIELVDNEGLPFELTAPVNEVKHQLKEELIHSNLENLKHQESEVDNSSSLEPQLQLFKRIRDLEADLRWLIDQIELDKIKEEADGVHVGEWEKRKNQDKNWRGESEDKVTEYASFSEYSRVILELHSDFGISRDAAKALDSHMARLANKGRNPLMHNRSISEDDISESRKLIKQVEDIIGRESNFGEKF
jgi:hypothetical protein